MKTFYSIVYAVITFGKPNMIDLTVTRDHLDQLFTALIKEKPGMRRASLHNKIQSVRAEFVPSVLNFFASDMEITPVEFDALTFPVKLDLIGKNETTVFARFLDFEKALNHILSIMNLSISHGDYFGLYHATHSGVKCASDSGVNHATHSGAKCATHSGANHATFFC